MTKQEEDDDAALGTFFLFRSSAAWRIFPVAENACDAAARFLLFVRLHFHLHFISRISFTDASILTVLFFVRLFIFNHVSAYKITHLLSICFCGQEKESFFDDLLNLCAQQRKRLHTKYTIKISKWIAIFGACTLYLCQCGMNVEIEHVQTFSLAACVFRIYISTVSVFVWAPSLRLIDRQTDKQYIYVYVHCEARLIPAFIAIFAMAINIKTHELKLKRKHFI